MENDSDTQDDSPKDVEESSVESLANFDFRQPTKMAPGAEHRISDWFRRVQALLPIKLGGHVPGVECTVLPQQVGAPDEVTPPHPMLAFRVRVNGEHETILAFQRPLAITMVACMLGEELTELREDRELSLVEQALFDLVVRDLVELFHETGEPIHVHSELLGGERRAQLIRLFPPGEPLVMFGLQIKGAFGSGDVCWIWPQALAEQLFDTESPVVPSPHLPELAKGIPFDLTVRLGEAKLNLQQLSSLKPGDVVVLDQLVSEPLVAEVGGASKLTVWPGRDGGRQAVQVGGMKVT